MSQYTRVTDRQTDGQTDGQTDRLTEFSSLDRVCIACSAVKTSVGNQKSIAVSVKGIIVKKFVEEISLCPSKRMMDVESQHHHHIRLLNNRQNAVAQTEMRGEEVTYTS